jgi:hypothetical protein
MFIYAVENPEEEIPVTSRMARSLIKELEDVAKKERRSRSKVIAILLERGMSAYRRDGILLNHQTGAERSIQTAALAQRFGSSEQEIILAEEENPALHKRMREIADENEPSNGIEHKR